MKTLPIAELRGLLSAVSENGRQHLVEVEDDLLQTTHLLSAAVDKLSSSFMAIHATVTEQQRVMAVIMQNGELEPLQQTQLDAYQHRITIQVDTAVNALQFQDLTNQLLTRTIQRVNGLKTLLQALSAHGDDFDPNQEHEEIARFLAHLSENLHAGSTALSGGLRRSVDQRHMDSGDIELF
jgi:beta-N-acetylglucosaminidase